MTLYNTNRSKSKHKSSNLYKTYIKMAKISLDSVQFAEPISTAVVLEGRKMRQIAFYNNDFDEVYLKPSGLNPDEYWDMMAENWNESRWEIDVCAYLSLLMNQYVEPI